MFQRSIDYPDWNTRENGKNNGQFNENGNLVSFLSLDFVYSKMQLQEAHADGGHIYVPYRDAMGNVTGYRHVTSIMTARIVLSSTVAVISCIVG